MPVKRARNSRPLTICKYARLAANFLTLPKQRPDPAQNLPISQKSSRQYSWLMAPRPEAWLPPAVAGPREPTFPPPTGPPPIWVPVPDVPRVPLADPQTRRVLRVELVVVAFAAALPGLIIALRGLGDPASIDTDDVDVVEVIAALMAALGPAAVTTYLLWRDGRLTVAGFGRRSPGFIFGYGMLGLASAVGALTAIGIVIALVAALFGNSEVTGESPDVSFTIGSLAVALGLSLVAGISEEIVYRAYGITRMEEIGLPRAAMVVPWALWTLQHLYAGILAPIVVGTVGATWVWLYRWKRSIWPLIFAHVLYDIGVFALAVAVSES